MVQHLLSLGYKGIRSNYSIYGYSRKEYEYKQLQRREAIKLKFQENLSLLSALLYESGESSLAEGGGRSGAGMEGGKTFYSFFK
jgi:hypothetical protein